MRIYPTIAEALTLGRESWPSTACCSSANTATILATKRNKPFTRDYEFFTQIVDVFRKSGRSVPVFNDKHLSWNWDWARDMVDTSRQLGFPLMAGSSLPVTRRLPAIDFPLRERAAGSVGDRLPGGVDSYDFHVLGNDSVHGRAAPRRRNGVVAVQAIRGDDVWRRMASRFVEQSGAGIPGSFTPASAAAFSSARPVTATAMFIPRADDIRKLVKTPVAYRIEYADGLKATMLLLNGAGQRLYVCRAA